MHFSCDCILKLLISVFNSSLNQQHNNCIEVFNWSRLADKARLLVNANSGHSAKQIISSVTGSGRMSYFTSELMRITRLECLPMLSEQSHQFSFKLTSIPRTHTQTQSCWQSGHTKLMLWQRFLQTNTYAFARRHTQRSRHAAFPVDEGGDISRTLGQGEEIDSFWRERAEKRETEGSNTQKKQSGQWRDE